MLKTVKGNNKHNKKEVNRLQIDTELEDYFEAIDMNDGDESSSVQAWQSCCFEPTTHDEPTTERPNVTYVIDHVYGARMEDSRQNVHINWDGHIVYMSACMGIVYDPRTRDQKIFGGGEINLDDPKTAKHFPGHTEEIMWLALDNERCLAASGQIGNKPYVFIWDAKTGIPKTRIKMKPGSQGIYSITFSPDGDRIACVDATNDHNVWIYILRTNKLQKWIPTDSKNKFDIDWTLHEKGCNVIALAGIDHTGFITNYKGDFKNSTYSKGITKLNMTTDYVWICFDK